MTEDRGLGWLVAPVPVDAFLRDHWERNAMSVARNQPDRFAGLLTMDDIDGVLTGGRLRGDDLQMTNAARAVTPQAYLYPSGVVDPVRLFQEYADGSTIILPQLHERLPRLAGLCRALEREVGARFQTNIYLTPGNAQGFKRHYDNHDVFVLQVAGRKHWRLYDAPVELPMQGQGFKPEAHPEGPVTAAFTLAPGDTAYVPRGLMHDAESDGAPSLHITLGVLPRTWHDLFFEALAAVSLQEPALRRGLPPGFVRAGFDRGAARATFADLADRIRAAMDFDAALDRFADEIVGTRQPLLWGQLDQVRRLADLAVDNVVSARPDLVTRIERRDDDVTVHCYGNAVALPAHAADALLAILDGPPCRIADLPGPLDAEGRLVLVRRLVREGLAVVQ
ncbi:MAG: cupin domain-containing protein [Alphaproteobacteria bacterium]